MFAERRAHAALRRAGVRAGGVELGDHGGPHAARGLDRGAQPGAAGADDHRVVRVGRGHAIGTYPGHFDGSNVKTMTVPEHEQHEAEDVEEHVDREARCPAAARSPG